MPGAKRTHFKAEWIPFGAKREQLEPKKAFQEPKNSFRSQRGLLDLETLFGTRRGLLEQKGHFSALKGPCQTKTL